MNQRDYYEVLQVERTATGEVIKKAYRRLAMQYHPDRNPDDAAAEEKFKEAAEAYDILRDADKRARYDRFGHAGVSGNGGGFSNNEDIFSHFSDIFGDIFGFGAQHASRGPRPQQGANLRYNLTINLMQAAKGADVPLRLPKIVSCADCAGSGAAPGTQPETCKHCGGTGQLRHQQGFFQLSVPCTACRGEGTIIETPCPRCKGAGVQQETKELAVHIPPGVATGNRLRLRGEGDPGVYGGPPGDLYVVITVEEDKTFQRQGQHIIQTVEISFVEATLGHKMDVPTLDKATNITIPKGTQSGETFRIKGLGLPYVGENRNGDLLVEVIVRTPTRLSSEQEELLKKFASLEESKPLQKAKKIMKKVGKAMGMD